jgi:hypothetical protein
VILAGAGARGAGDELEEAAERLGAVIVKPMLGKDCVPDDSPYTTGAYAMVGTRPSQEAIQNCDAFFIVGSSSPYVEWMPAPGQATGVQIDEQPTVRGGALPHRLRQGRGGLRPGSGPDQRRLLLQGPAPGGVCRGRSGPHRGRGQPGRTAAYAGDQNPARPKPGVGPRPRRAEPRSNRADDVARDGPGADQLREPRRGRRADQREARRRHRPHRR